MISGWLWGAAYFWVFWVFGVGIDGWGWCWDYLVGQFNMGLV